MRRPPKPNRTMPYYWLFCMRHYLFKTHIKKFTPRKAYHNMSTSPNMDERIERMNQAAEHGNTDAFYIIIQKDVKLLKHIDKLPFVNTPLHIAAYAGHIPFAMELMKLKPSFSRKLNPDGFSPIHLALQNGHGELVCRLLEIDGKLFTCQRKGRYHPFALHSSNRISP